MIVEAHPIAYVAVTCNKCNIYLGGSGSRHAGGGEAVVRDRWGDVVQSRFRAPVLADIAARDDGWSVLEDGSHFCPDCTALIITAAPKVTVLRAKASTEFAGQPIRQDVLYAQIERGLKKAKREYDRIARESGFLKPATRECWSEVESAFEALADLRAAARRIDK